MNSKKQASKIKRVCRGSGDQAATHVEKKEREREKLQKERRNKNLALFHLISSYVIWLKNVCLQVRAPPVRKRLLKTLHSSLLH